MTVLDSGENGVRSLFGGVKGVDAAKRVLAACLACVVCFLYRSQKPPVVALGLGG